MKTLDDFLDPTSTRNQKLFKTKQLKEKKLLEKAKQEQGFPDGFGNDDAHIRWDIDSDFVFWTNDDKQMLRINPNTERLEFYEICPKCRNMGFRSSINHAPKCTGR